MLNVALRNPDFPLHQLAPALHGVQYVIAGHIHQMLHLELEGITDVSMASSGGHLRASGRYEDGWFFAHALLGVGGQKETFRIHETAAPHGKGRITDIAIGA